MGPRFAELPHVWLACLEQVWQAFRQVKLAP